MDVFKGIRIYKSEGVPPGAFALVGQSSEPCPECYAVPTVQWVTASCVVRACLKCKHTWDYKRTDTDAAQDAP